MSVLNDFINNTGYSNLLNKTTHEVVHKYIIPLTRRTNTSYANYIRHNTNTNNNTTTTTTVYKANIFICHSWRYKFLDVVNSITNYVNTTYSNTDNTFIHFDAFCVNQNTTSSSSITIDWLTLTYNKIIKNINHTLVILSYNDNDDDNTIVLRRSFALYEMYSSIHSNTKMSITITNMDEFRSSVCRAPIIVLNKVLSYIKFHDSHTTITTNKDILMKALLTMTSSSSSSSSSSIETIDKIITNKIHDCLLDIMTQCIDQEHDDTKKMSLLSAVARLHKSRGSFELAEQLFLQNLDKMKLKLGHSHKEVYRYYY